uniref:Uncharacterized protein n=1 Tax=Anopheles epiroticus TaxID=199890 RepID=A0A182PIX8_9DIPT
MYIPYGWCKGGGECVTTDRPALRRDAEYPPPRILAFVKPLRQQCIRETGVSVEALERFSDADIFEDDQALKCYMQCMFRLSNVTDDRGELHLGKMFEFVSVEFEDITLRMGARCTKPKGKDLCERAFWFHKCWKTSDPTHYYLA